MANNEEISFDVPHLWMVFQLAFPDNEVGKVERMGIYRLQRGSGELLAGPMFVDLANGGRAQAKIVYEDIPLVYIEQPTDQERTALLETFKQAAKELNDDERDGGLLDMAQASTRAAAIIRLRLTTLGLRNDWKK
jgi:hypothetical protein